MADVITATVRLASPDERSAASRDARAIGQTIGHESAVEIEAIDGVVIGSWVAGRRGGRRLGKLGGRAARRLAEMAALASWRARNGVLLADPHGWLIVAADALFELDGLRPWSATPACLLDQFPALDADAIDEDALVVAFAAPKRPGRLIAGPEAGRLIEFTMIERNEMVGEGQSIRTFDPRDESTTARNSRRIEKRRQMDAIRAKRYRRSKVEAAAKCVTSPNVTFGVDVTYSVTHPIFISKGTVTAPDVTFVDGKAPSAVMAALQSGANTAHEIAVLTGHPVTTIKVALGRFVRADLVERVGRGLYAIPK